MSRGASPSAHHPIPDRKLGCVRYVSFNINGAKTLFNYHPWNTLKGFDAVFEQLHADVISLQELKVLPATIADIKVAHLKQYRLFVSVPKSKKGYSGVGLFVRVPTESDPPQVAAHLAIHKAEEGITGHLTSPDHKTPYVELDENIGGYVDLDRKEALHIDSQGRCVVVELGSSLVVFSVYCPANSMRTEQGEKFRLDFLSVLFERCRLLKQMGKRVVVMGDVNVSLDLIDHADTIAEWRAQNIITSADADLETAHFTECVTFKSSTAARKLLNRYTYPTLDVPPTSNHILYDTTRLVQGRRRAMYTVWNTLTGARQTNYGSRIDYILTSCPKLAHNISDANILPHLHGSDHCPVFTDFEVDDTDTRSPPKRLGMEVKHLFKVPNHADISGFFRKRTASAVLASEPGEKTKLVYTSRKKTNQKNITTFFARPEVAEAETPPMQHNDPPKKVGLSILGVAHQLYGAPPTCRHGLKCQLKTSTTEKSKGRKFWSCVNQSRNTLNGAVVEGVSCDYFEWAT